MKKPTIILLGTLLVAAATVVAVKLGGQRRYNAAPTPRLHTSGETVASELSASLEIVDPTEDQLRTEVALLRDEAQLHEEIPEPDETASERLSSAAAEVIRSVPPLQRDYDLLALQELLVSTLENEDVDERRDSLLGIAALLAEQGDPEVAGRFMQAILSTRDQFTDSDAYAFATSFVDDFAKVEPETAAKWTEHLPERLQYPTQQLVASHWVQQSPSALEAWSQTIADAGQRAGVIRMISQILGASDPEGFATGWAQRLAQNPADGPRLSDVVTKHWGAADFDAALQWVRELPHEDDRKNGVLGLVKQTAAVDAAGTAEWVEASLQGAVRQEAIQLTVTSWLNQDPAAAASWVNQLNDAKVFDNAFDMIAIAWLRKDQATAERWIEAASVSQDRKDYVHTVSQN